MNVSIRQNTWFVDWISATIPVGFLGLAFGVTPTVGQIDWLGQDLHLGASFIQDKAHFGYSFCWRSRDTGARLMYNPLRPDMGLLVVLTGQNLERIAWTDAVSNLKRFNARFTRLDLAVDTSDERVRPEVLHSAVKAGRLITRARKWTFVEGNPGNTLYIGKRGSPKFLRIYDKAAEQGISGMSWTRLELEVKGSAARWVAERIGSLSGKDYASLMRGVADFSETPGYAAVLGSGEIGVHIESEKRVTDAEAWIFGVVLKVFRRLYRARPGILGEFVHEVEAD